MADPTHPVRFTRVLQVLLRSAHIGAMGMVLGGCFVHLPAEAMEIPIWVTVATGCAMFGLDLVKDWAILHQGNGAFVLFKLLLLGMGHVFPHQRFGWYLSATVAASIGSHMPGAWRHYSLWYRRDMGNP